VKKRRLANATKLDELIREIRGQKVRLDFDLARIYGVPTKALNQAVKRNRDRFPAAFLFQLSGKEWKDLRCQFGTSSSPGSMRSQIVTASRRS
jgi:ORF6N domain